MNVSALKSRMTELNMSTAQLTKVSGVSESTIKRIMRGKNDVHISTLRMIASAVALDPRELFDENVPAPESFDPSNVPEISAQVLEELTVAAQNEPIMGQMDPEKWQNPPSETHMTPEGVTNAPTSPLKEEGAENVFKTLNVVVDIYKERISSMIASHDKETEHIEQAYCKHLYTLRIVACALGIATGILMLFIIALFAYDILDPSVGWFQH